MANDMTGPLAIKQFRGAERRFDNGWSQSRIGREIGVSQMQVSRWLRVITEKLRSCLER